MDDNFYKITIFEQPLLKDRIVFVADTRKIYQITFENGKKDLIKILGTDLYVNVKSILKQNDIHKGKYKVEFKDFVKMVSTGRIEKTEYEEE